MALNDLLDAYLEGCDFDSQGCFTLDGRGPRQGSTGSEYLLRLVQSAVAGGARRIDIKTGRDRLEMRCNLADAPSAAELAEALRRPLQTLESASLALLVRGLFQASLQPIQYLIWARSGLGVLIDSEGKARLLDLPSQDTLLQVRFADGGQSLWQRLRRLPPAAVVQATQMLTARCRYAPVPIRLDGRLVNPPLQPPPLPREPFYRLLAQRWVLSSRPPEFLMAAPHPASFPARFYDLDGTSAELRLGRQVFFQQWLDEKGKSIGARVARKSGRLSAPDQLELHRQNEITECTRALGLSAWSRTVDEGLATRAHLTIPGLVSDLRCWIEVVHYGVSLDAVAVDLEVAGARAVVAASELQTDYSGSKVVEDDDFHRVVTEIRGQFRDLQRQVAGLETRYKRLHGPIQNWK